EPAPEIAPRGMLFLGVMTKHHVNTRFLRMSPKAHRLCRRMLAIIIQVHNMPATCLSPTGEYGIVLTEIAGVLDVDDRNARRRDQFTTKRRRGIATAVVDQ